MIGKALYTINKEAKKLRDLKYEASDFYINGYTDNENLIEYLERLGFELDENGRKVVHDQYGRSFYDLNSIKEAIDEAYMNPFDEDEGIVEDDVEDLRKCDCRLREMIEKEHEIAKDLKQLQKYYYDIKEEVLKKLSLKPIAYHDFHGEIMALYEFEGFTFHQPVEELPEGVHIDGRLEWIDSKNMLEEPISVDEATRIIKLFLEK